MSAIASNFLFLIPAAPVVSTSAAPDASLASDWRTQLASNWERLIDFRLIEWGHGAGLVEDESFRRPSRISVAAAIEAAKQSVKEDMQPPNRVVPNGDGGLAFEWERGLMFMRIEFLEDGQIETALFDGARMIHHQILD